MICLGFFFFFKQTCDVQLLCLIVCTSLYCSSGGFIGFGYARVQLLVQRLCPF